MKAALKFAAVVLGPLLAALALPVPCLGMSGVLLTLIYLVDRDSGLAGSEIAAYWVWACGPIPAAAGMLGLGMLCRAVHARWRSACLTWALSWALFSGWLYLVAWYGITLLTSVSMAAADSEGYTFVVWTATAAAVVTVVGQVGVIPWLYLASRIVVYLDPAFR